MEGESECRGGGEKDEGADSIETIQLTPFLLYGAQFRAKHIQYYVHLAHTQCRFPLFQIAHETQPDTGFL